MLSLAVLGGFLPSVLGAQAVLDAEEDLDTDRPEAWAMAWFGSVSLMSRLGESPELPAGDWELGLEGSWVPTLSEEERRVGFNGKKVEDLNRSSVFGRLRGAVGLPGGFVLGFGWVPPVEIDGIDPESYSLSLGRALAEGSRWRLDARVLGRYGSYRGDITCDRASVAAGDDPERNPFGCEEPSRDEVDLRSGSLELTLGFGRSNSPWRPWIGVLGTYFDNEFQVDARYSGLVDRTLLRVDHWTGAATAGLRYRGDGSPVGIAGELFYSPLEVKRPDQSSETDALFHVRLQASYRFP